MAIITFHSGEDRRVKKAFRPAHRAGVYAEVAKRSRSLGKRGDVRESTCRGGEAPLGGQSSDIRPPVITRLGRQAATPSNSTFQLCHNPAPLPSPTNLSVTVSALLEEVAVGEGLPLGGRHWTVWLLVSPDGDTHAEGDCREAAADDHHGLAAATELVYRKPGDAVVSGRDGRRRVSASSMSTRCRCTLRDQEVAGLDIVTDGDCRFDQDVGGQSWTSYPPHHMSGFETRHPKLAKAGAGGIAFPRGHILHDYLEARVMPTLVGPVGPRRDAVCRAVQDRPASDDQACQVRDGDAGARRVRGAGRALQGPAARASWRLSDAFNEELHDLADAGCPVIQMEEPQIHLLAARGYVDKVINPEFMLKVFNNTVKGLRAKTEVWCHTCWGNPSQQRMFATVQCMQPALELLNQVDADVITFEMKSSNADRPRSSRAGDHRKEGVHRRRSITTRCRSSRRRRSRT